MATPAQINANRANAQKSTGPRSVEGKSASRFNALKHGIDAASIVIPGEDPAVYDSLVAQYLHEYRPQSASESFHVDTMIRADWQKRRLETVEADLYRTIIAESPDNSLAAVLLAESPASKLLAPHPAPDRRLRTHLAPRQYRAPPRPCKRPKTRQSPDSLAGPPPAELASFPQSANSPLPHSPAAPAWPPIDEKTGKPRYFVG